jgi:hypothetical protein
MKCLIKSNFIFAFFHVFSLAQCSEDKKGSGSVFSTTLDGFNASTTPRSPRLFSNPFGILGHADCQAKLAGNRQASGVCYNELECLVRKGGFTQYCGPPAITGVCCVFTTNKCRDVVVTERVAYYTNANYPFSDSKPDACLLRIKPQSNTCWVILYRYFFT